MDTSGGRDGGTQVEEWREGGAQMKERREGGTEVKEGKKKEERLQVEERKGGKKGGSNGTSGGSNVQMDTNSGYFDA